MSLRIAIIVGTTRPNRRGRLVGQWVFDSLPKKSGVVYELIDLASENLPFLADQAEPGEQKYDQESTKSWSKKIDSFDGYIWVTSEYNAGPPAPLKNAIDTLYKEWGKKPVAFVGYGWMGAVRSIEKLITTASRMNMVPLSAPAIHIIDIGRAIDEESKVNPEHVRGNFGRFEQNLVWWAQILKVAREAP